MSLGFWLGFCGTIVMVAMVAVAAVAKWRHLSMYPTGRPRR